MSNLILYALLKCKCVLYEYTSKNEFPTTGNSFNLYVDISNKNIYVWDESQNQYIKVSNGDLSDYYSKDEIQVLFDQITIEKLDVAENGFSSSYQLTIDGKSIGDKINIPRDLVVESGSVKECTVADTPVTGYVVGDKYIDLVLANSDNQHVYVLVSDLVDKVDLSNYYTKSEVDTALTSKADGVNGVATSTNKLATARKITLDGKITGNANFNGSNDITINTSEKFYKIDSANKSNYPYHRILHLSLDKAKYVDNSIMFEIRSRDENPKWCFGSVNIRQNSDNVNSVYKLKVLNCSDNFEVENLVCGFNKDFGNTYIDVFYKCGTYARTILYITHPETLSGTVTAYNSNEVLNTTDIDKLSSYEVYKSIEDAGKELYGSDYTYTSIRTAVLNNRSACDSIGQDISTTYIKDLSISGNTVTFTRGNNSTGTTEMYPIKSQLDAPLVDGATYKLGVLTSDITLTLPETATADIEVDFAIADTVHNINCDYLSLDVVANTYYQVIFSYDKALNMWFASVVSSDYISTTTAEVSTDETTY